MEPRSSEPDRIFAADEPKTRSRASTSLTDILARSDQDRYSDLRSIVVMRQGNIVIERYYNGENQYTLHDVRSAGKSVTALLVGAAIDHGKIRSLTDPVSLYWRDAKGTAVGDVALADILTMRSGLAAFDADADSPGNEDNLDASADPLAFTLSIPRADPPGNRYRYNSLTAYVAGVVVQMATGVRLEDFARGALFSPLGITRWQWSSDIKGHTKGQGNLSLTARDFAKLGQMVLDQGVYQRRRVISASWINEALQPRVSIADDDPYADGYGYFWYYKATQIGAITVPVSFASGNGGNKIYVVPSRDLVVAITSAAYGRSYGQRRSESIFKAILAQDMSVD